MVKVYTAVFIIFISVNYCVDAVVAQNQNRIKLDDRDFWTYSFLAQNRFKRDHVSAVQPNVVVMSGVPNSNYGVVPNSRYSGVPNSYDRGSTVIVQMPNDVYNTRMGANPNVVTRI